MADWHEAIETPTLNEWILVQRYDDTYSTCLCEEYLLSKTPNMAFATDAKDTYFIKKWCYIKDIKT